MKNALMVTSVASMIKQFNISNINILQNLGYKVTIATNFQEPGTIPIEDSRDLYHELLSRNIEVIDIPFSRLPVNPQNLRAYNQLKLLIQTGKFDLIHCQSPIGGVLTRLAAKKSRKKGTKVIYTAHGFHFFKGSPIKNWLFYPVEKKLSNYTDLLITINHEDFQRGKEFGTCEVTYVPGVGVDTYSISECYVEKDLKRKEIGVPIEKFMILSVGEINNRKNHRVIIEALHLMNNQNIHYVICGQGELKEDLQTLVKSYNLKSQVHFLGYRNDVEELFNISDIFAFPSKREGLGLAGIEAMAAGLPILTSNVNGINDYSIDGVTGNSFSFDDIKGFKDGIERILNLSEQEREDISKANIERSRKFDKRLVNEKMKLIYQGL